MQHLHEEWRRTVGMNGLGSPLTSWPVRCADQPKCASDREQRSVAKMDRDGIQDFRGIAPIAERRRTLPAQCKHRG